MLTLTDSEDAFAIAPGPDSLFLGLLSTLSVPVTEQNTSLPGFSTPVFHLLTSNSRLPSLDVMFNVSLTTIQLDIFPFM